MRSLLLSGFLSLYKGIDYDLTPLQLQMSASDLMRSQASAGQSTASQTSASQTSGDFPAGVKFTVRRFAHDACWNCQTPGLSGVDVCHVLAKEDNLVCSYITANFNRS